AAHWKTLAVAAPQALCPPGPDRQIERDHDQKRRRQPEPGRQPDKSDRNRGKRHARDKQRKAVALHEFGIAGRTVHGRASICSGFAISISGPWNSCTMPRTRIVLPA